MKTMKNKMLFALVLFSSVLLQMGCVSSEIASPAATVASSEFCIRDTFVLADVVVYYLYKSKP